MARQDKNEMPVVQDAEGAASEEFDFEKALELAELGLDAAESAATGNRAEVTKAAQDNALEAARLAGIAAESDENADEALRLLMIAERAGEREQIKKARAKGREARRQARHDHNKAIRMAKKAYNNIKFSSPTRLGFLRVIQVYILLTILSTILQLTTLIKGSYVLGAYEIIDMLVVVLSGVTFWLIMKRKKLTRIWAICTSAFAIVAPAICNIATGSFVWSVWLALSFYHILMIIYFATSQRVRQTLINPMSQRSLGDDIIDDRSFFQPKTWAFWRNLLIYFALFSIVGHWMEAGVCLLIKYGIVPGTYDPTSQIWSDWLYPFPVYGIGFVLCGFLLYPLKNALQKKFKRVVPCIVLSFIANMLVCTAIEFFMGLAVNADLQLWDYTNMFGNIMGQVCLLYSSFFGLVATIMTWVIYPALERLFRRIPVEGMNGLFVITLVGYMVLLALYYINVVFTGQGVEVLSAGACIPGGDVPSAVAAYASGVPWLS